MKVPCHSKRGGAIMFLSRIFLSYSDSFVSFVCCLKFRICVNLRDLRTKAFTFIIGCLSY